MGGVVFGVVGFNWMFIGDVVVCVNLFNGEGIDYGLEIGWLVVELLDLCDLVWLWLLLLVDCYGCGFLVVCWLVLLLIFLWFLFMIGFIMMCFIVLMNIVVWVMFNLVIDDDCDWVVWVWCGGG